MKAHEQEERAIREYVINQSPAGEIVRSAEKVHSETVLGKTYDIWDVKTRRQGWWVITNITNLYLQKRFPSMDECLTFHIGLMERLIANQPRRPGHPRQKDRLGVAWRLWEQASEAADEAGEAEEFQAVGMRCREALLSFIHKVQDPAMVPDGEDVPKRSDFVGWTRLIAKDVAGDDEQLRNYLRDVAKATWPLVNWLTHAKNAVRLDCTIASGAASEVLFSFGAALLRKDAGLPDICPDCGSYRVHHDWRPEFGPDHEYASRCETCGWESLPADLKPDWDRVPEHIRDVAQHPHGKPH